MEEKSKEKEINRSVAIGNVENNSEKHFSYKQKTSKIFGQKDKLQKTAHGWTDV